MTPRIITADEAQALLDAATRGPWQGAGEYDEPADVFDCAGILVASDAWNDGNRALVIAAPDLAATVIAQAAENERLRAIVDGRATPPTDAEIAAHEAAGGWWRCAPDGDRRGLPPLESFRSDTARAVTSWAYVMGHTIRWWALDAQCRPCAWPVVKAKR